MKKKLPMSIPINACYPAISQTSGILFADPLIHDWLMNNFIQVFEVDQETHAIDYYDYCAEGNPFLSYNEIDYSFINKNWLDLASFIESAIDDNYYIRIFVNIKEIKAYSSNTDAYHDLMVYGYDSDNKIIYIADHFSAGKLLLKTCSYKEINRATFCFEPDKCQKEAYLSSVQMIKKECDFMRLRYSMYSPEQMDYIMTFNTNRVYNSLLCYLEGKPVDGWFSRGRVMDSCLEKSHRWGIQCYDVLLQNIENIETNDKEFLFAKQSFHVMTNHKTVMIERLNTLQSRYQNIDWSTYIEDYLKIESILKKATLQFMKCQMYRKCNRIKCMDICKRIREAIDSAGKKDFESTRRLLDVLSSIRRVV